MKIKSAVEKWASGVLGGVCLLLLMDLVRHGVRAGAEKPSLPRIHSPEARRLPVVPPGAADELARYNPDVKLDLLSDLQSRELPKIDRNPFEFPKPKETPKPIGPPGPPVTSTATLPPPLPIKLIGYSEKAGGQKEGIVSGEDGIYIVHEGETFAKRYKVNKLSATMVEIYDETTRQTVELPIAP